MIAELFLIVKKFTLAKKGAEKDMEYLNFRCCMCPNLNKDQRVCPGIKGSPHPKSSICRFVKTYMDEDGWVYKVVQGWSVENYKARYRKPKQSNRDNITKVTSGPMDPKLLFTSLEWRRSFDEAQSDLNELARENLWEEYRND